MFSKAEPSRDKAKHSHYLITEQSCQELCVWGEHQARVTATDAGLKTFASALRPTELTVIVTWHWAVAISFLLILSFTKSKRDLGPIHIIFILYMRKPKPAVAKQLQNPCSQNPMKVSWQQVRGHDGHPLPLRPSNAVLPTWLGSHVPRCPGRSQMISFPFSHHYYYTFQKSTIPKILTMKPLCIVVQNKNSYLPFSGAFLQRQAQPWLLYRICSEV